MFKRKEDIELVMWSRRFLSSPLSLISRNPISDLRYPIFLATCFHKIPSSWQAQPLDMRKDMYQFPWAIQISDMWYGILKKLISILVSPILLLLRMVQDTKGLPSPNYSFGLVTSVMSILNDPREEHHGCEKVSRRRRIAKPNLFDVVELDGL
jgi:hypothetical protein